MLKNLEKQKAIQVERVPDAFVAHSLLRSGRLKDILANTEGKIERAEQAWFDGMKSKLDDLDVMWRNKERICLK